MDPERRRQLEQRRRFLKPRIVGRELRGIAEPAFHVLEAAGETFSVYRLGEGPRWTPEWWPVAYSSPWSQFADSHFSEFALYPHEQRAFVFAMLNDRLRSADRLLVCGQFTLELKRAAFERHYDAVMRTFGGDAHIAAPPAQWAMRIAGQVVWRDPETG